MYSPSPYFGSKKWSERSYKLPKNRVVSQNSSEVQEGSCKACRFIDESNMKKEMTRMKDKEMKMMINMNCDLKDYVTNGNIC